MLVQNGWTDDLLPRPRGAARLPHAPASGGQLRGAARSATSATRAGPEQAGGRPAPARSGRPLLRRLPQGRGQAAQRRERHRLHADLPRGRSGRRPVPGPQLGRPCIRAACGSRRVGRQTISSGGGDPGRRRRRSTRSAARDACAAVPAARAPGDGRRAAHGDASRSRCSASRPCARSIRTKGRGGMIAARLWDVAPGPADAGRARHLPPRGQPEGPDRLPAVRQRLALRARPRREARAGRQRPELPAAEQLRLQREGVEDRRGAAGPLGTESIVSLT